RSSAPRRLFPYTTPFRSLLAGPGADRYNGWRTEVAWGEPYDLTARMLLGVSAHAGLFGTARAVHAVAREFLGDGNSRATACTARDRKSTRLNSSHEWTSY